MNKVKDENRDFDEYKNSFKTSLRRILYNIKYLKIWEVWYTQYLLIIIFRWDKWIDNANE